MRNGLGVTPLTALDGLVRSIGSVPKGTDLLFAGTLFVIVAIVLKKATSEERSVSDIQASTAVNNQNTAKPVMVTRRDAAA